MPKQEITATFYKVKHRFENDGDQPDVIIFSGEAEVDGKKKNITLKGLDEGELYPHSEYRFYGDWQPYANRRTGKSEQQFHYSSYVPAEPHGRQGIIRYLERAPSIGKVLASRLFEQFGQDAVKTLRETPAVASEAIDRLSYEGADAAAAWLATQEHLENVTIDLIELLDKKGFPRELPKKCIKKWGSEAPTFVRKDAFRLMSFRGCGFKLCDTLYLDLGGDPSALKRQALCIWYGLRNATAMGDTWHYIGVVEQLLKGSIGGTRMRMKEALRLAFRGRLTATMWTDGPQGEPQWDGATQWVADATKARNERELAQRVAAAMGDSSGMAAGPRPDGITPHQSHVVDQVFERGNIGILGGSPGTGKTYTAVQIIKRLLKRGMPPDQIAVCAPTGKAAVRISEVLAEAGIPIQALTIHSTLGVQHNSSSEGWSFIYNETNKLPVRVIVVDEESMVDVDLNNSLMAARGEGTFIFFVGDVNQLAPVGHGAPLRDMIDAGVPYGELREIIRNDGGIVQACADIRDGKDFKCGGNLTNQQGGVDAMLSILAEKRFADFDPVWDCQVMCAVNENNELSRRELNKILQVHLNHNPSIPNCPFRLGDKVMCLKNGWYDFDRESGEQNQPDEFRIANGDIGQVWAVEPKFYRVHVMTPDRWIIVPRGAAGKNDDDSEDGKAAGSGCNWDLAYAVTTHKMQGSEIPIAIVMIDDSQGARFVCDRSWWYTATSRAKLHCYLVGNLDVVYRDCKKNNIGKRKTFLSSLIRQARAKF